MILSQLIGLLLLPTAAVSNLSPETEQALRGSLEAQLETAHEGHTVKRLRTLRKRVFDQGDNPSPGVDPTRNQFVVNPAQTHPTKKNSESDGDLTPKIVNGVTVSPPRKYKFFASIGGCGASLVAPNVLLSAAHCSSITGPAILGLHYKTAPDVDEFEALEVIPFKNGIPHPLYRSQTLDYDFWVIELEWDSQLYQDHIVELDTPNDDLILAQGDDMTVIGMGTLSSGGSTPSAMQEVTVDYITNANCCASYSYSCNEITDRMLCAARSGKDSCQGDSGGPLFVDLGDGKYKQVGVVSWGYGCADSNYPGVYSRVSEAYTWIKTQIDNYNSFGTNPPPAKVDGQCYDSPEGWFDRDGPSYSCDWYSSGSNCAVHGDSYANAGVTANQVCCVCGAGEIYVGSPTTKSPTGSPTTSNPTNPQTPSPTNVPTTANPTQTIPPVTKYLCRKNQPLASDICLSGLELDTTCSAEGQACGGPKTCHITTCSTGVAATNSPTAACTKIPTGSTVKCYANNECCSNNCKLNGNGPSVNKCL